MAILNFPDTTGQPTDGSFTYTENDVIYVWDGAKWTAGVANNLTDTFVNRDGDTMTGDLTVPNLISEGDVQTTSLNGGPLAGFRNLLINPAFTHWQRGTAGMPAPDAVRYYADRWASFKTAGAAVNDVQQIADAPDIPGVSISTRTNATDLRQVIEDGGVLYLKAGTTWTLSGWAKGNGASSPLTPSVIFCADSAATSNTTVIHTGPAVNVGTSWTYWSTTFTVASGSPAGQDHVMVSTATTGDLFQTALQLEQGSVATPFEMRPIGTELALCQRYFMNLGSIIAFPHVDVPGSRLLSRDISMRAAPEGRFTNEVSANFANGAEITPTYWYATTSNAGTGVVARASVTLDAEL